MDANGTRFHLLLGEDDWTRHPVPPEPPSGIEYRTDRQELSLARRPFRFRARPNDRAPVPDDRRGAASDAFGNVYWIDDRRRAIRVLSSGSGRTSLFWEPAMSDASCPPAAGGFGPVTRQAAAAECVLAGLAVTVDHQLVAGTAAPGGLIVFDLHAPPVPRRVLLPPDIGFVPFDLCQRAAGGVFVLDRLRTVLWEFDGHLAVVSRSAVPLPADPPTFAPVADGPGRHPSAPWRARPVASDARVLGGDPVAIEAAPGGRVLVLDRNAEHPPSVVRLLVPGEAGEFSAPLTAGPPDDQLAVVGHDMALVPSGADLGVLHVADREGNQSYRFALETDPFAADLVPEFLPMRLFGGKGLVSRVARRGRGAMTVYYDIGDTWVPLVGHDVPTFVPECTVTVAALDAHLPDTVWHRLMIDGCIPPGAEVAVQSRAADELVDLLATPWQPEPPLSYRRSTGSELPYLPEPRPGYGTYEVLFQHARGRHLQLRLRLRGDGRATPRLAALRALYPRPSWLAHLPRAYSEDRDSASFLDRFLANVEGIATGIEDRIVAAQALFDPRCAPADALDWLLGWFDVAADPAWDIDRRRLFLRHATELFAARGTVAGIELALRFALDPCLNDATWDGPGTAAVRDAFRARVTPLLRASQPGEPGAPGEPGEGPRVVPVGGRWDPEQGRDDLLDRWRATTGESDEPPAFDASTRWREFVRTELGFDPPLTVAAARWTEFLRGRYGSADALATAYGLVGTDRPVTIEAVGFPELVPADGAALRDWYQFLGVVLPSRAAAHRFTVLLPVALGNEDTWSPAERKAIAERVVAVQKPAHTVFDVRFFWAAFQVGEARLGADTVLGLGGRDPALHPALVLGREYAGESYLGGPPSSGVIGATTRSTP